MRTSIVRNWAAGGCLAIALFAGSGMPVRAADTTLYDDLGGRAGLTKIVDDAMALFLSDERIKGQFDNINIDRLKKRLVDKLCQVADGPCDYKGRDTTAAHKGLHLHAADFNALAEDLQTAMERCNIPFTTQNRFLARLAPMEHQVVTR
jgi:hemoglobin